MAKRGPDPNDIFKKPPIPALGQTGGTNLFNGPGYVVVAGLNNDHQEKRRKMNTHPRPVGRGVFNIRGRGTAMTIRGRGGHMLNIRGAAGAGADIPPSPPLVTGLRIKPGPNVPFRPPWQPGGPFQSAANWIPQSPDPNAWDRDSEQKWLLSSSRWEILGLGGWRGVRFLGLGGFGIVGLWQQTHLLNGNVESVVVKQQYMLFSSLESESRFLEMCNEAGSPHVVGLIKPYHEAVGQGSGRYDPAGQVARIYLEYCENGDLVNWMRAINSKFTPEKPIPEELVWRMWECLARAACVLESGEEDLNKPPRFVPGATPSITHFDIKPSNILVGGTDNDRHAKSEILKLADFGLALQVRYENQTDVDWALDIAMRGTRGWKPPEQLSSENPEYRKFGPWTNVWGFAKCIYYILTRDQDKEFYKDHMQELQGEHWDCYFTYGADLSQYLPANFYSNHLVNTLWQCLAQDWKYRPTPKELLRIVLDAISNLEGANGGDAPGTSGTPQHVGDEPMQVDDQDAGQNDPDGGRGPGQQGPTDVQMVDPLDNAAS